MAKVWLYPDSGLNKKMQMNEQIAIFIITTRSGPKVTHLPTPRDLLVKNPKLIADPIAIGSQAQCCH